MERLVGDVPATSSQPEAPQAAAEVNLASKIQTLADHLASSFLRGEEALVVYESKRPPPTLLQWALKEGIDTLVEILVTMKGAVITANSLRLRHSLHDVIRGGHDPTVMLVVSQHGLHADSSVREQGRTALNEAAKQGSISAVSALRCRSK